MVVHNVLFTSIYTIPIYRRLGHIDSLIFHADIGNCHRGNSILCIKQISNMRNGIPVKFDLGLRTWQFVLYVSDGILVL